MLSDNKPKIINIDFFINFIFIYYTIIFLDLKLPPIPKTENPPLKHGFSVLSGWEVKDQPKNIVSSAATNSGPPCEIEPDDPLSP